MNNLSLTKCQNLGEFTQKLDTIEYFLGNKNCEKNITKKISEFLENNKEYMKFDNKELTISLDRIGSKVKKIAADDPLVGKLRDYTRKLLPSDQEHVNNSLDFLRTRRGMAAIADWVNLNEISVAKLNLTLEELERVLPKLEHIDFSGFEYNNYDLKKFSEILLKIDLKSKISDKKVLVEIAKLCAQQNGGGTARNIKNFGIENQATLIEIAKLCAQQNSMTTPLHFKNFGIEDQAARIEIAKLCAQQAHNSTANDIENFGIKDQKALVEIAKLCAQHALNSTAACIKSFGIVDKAALIEIAKLCAQQNGEYTARNIQNFGIGDQAALVEIAKLCAEQNVRDTAHYIYNFRIEDQADLVDIAKFCAQRSGQVTGEKIQNFQITNQAALVEIAKLCAQQHGKGKGKGKGTAEYIKNFGIQDPASLIEIAKFCAQQDGASTAKFIKNFGIENKAYLIEIAMLCAQQNGGYTAKYIDNFGIEDQATLIEIAKLCAQQDGGGTAESIKKFRIEDRAALVDIAKLCAQQNGKGTAKNIQNFGIKDQPILVEIAKLCAQQDGGGTASNIKNFGIEDQATLAEIAKLCARKDGRGTAQYFENFGIEDPAAIVQIAKLCAQQNGEGTALYITNFGIKDQAALVKIAMLCAQQNVAYTVRYIENFGIKDQIALAEIAKLCAQQNGQITAENIDNFRIKDQSALTEIAKLCAQQNGWRTAENIDNFGIEDQATLIEIAKLCAQQNGQGTAENIQNFGINDEQILYGLLIECVNQDIDALFILGYVSPLPYALEKLSDLVYVLESDDEEKELRIQLFEAINELIEGLACSENYKSVIRESSEEIAKLAPHAQGAAALWLLQSLFLMVKAEPEAIDWMVENGMWRELGNLRKPNVRHNLTPGLFDLAQSGKNRKEWDTILSSQTGKKGLRLMAIPLSGLQQQGVNKELLMEFAKNLSLLKKVSKDASKVQTLLQMTHLLSFTNILTPEQKSSGFAKIFPKIGKDHTFDEKQILQNATAAKGLLQLKERQWVDSTESLRVLFRNCFEKLIPLNEFNGDASEKFDQIFASSRNPGGLLTYAAGLKTLNEPLVLDCLGRYVVSVFNGTFQEMRYETKNNPHLAKIFEARPDLREKWAKDVKVSLEEISGKGQRQEEGFDAKTWLRTKLIIDKHLGEEDVSYLRRYLEADSDETRKNIARELSTELSKQSKEKKKDELEKDPTLLNLKLQNACIKLANAGATETILTLDKNFREINQILHLKNAANEFSQDVKGILETLEKSKEKITGKETLQVLITDDPIDLLLAGTDVSGSCQRLDGDPGLNKGLLGYLMDGKNRLLAIKDKSGKIVARCMLRLLWDGKKPVIYRERFYPDTISAKESEALNNIAIQLAKELAVPLTGGGEGASYGKTLQALGGPAPYEYSDGSDGSDHVKKEGRYTISGATLVSS